MLSKEEQKELNAAISRLQDYRDQGEEMAELLQLGPAGKAKDGEIERAAKAVGKRHRCSIGNERARKSIMFSREFTSKHMMELVTLCNKYGYCPDFSLITLLFPLKLRDRRRLLKKAIKERWTKSDLDAEKERTKQAGQGDSKGRGRPPKAAQSLHALAGQARLGARNWRRVVDILDQPERDPAFKLTGSQIAELNALVKLLQKVSRWDD